MMRRLFVYLVSAIIITGLAGCGSFLGTDCDMEITDDSLPAGTLGQAYSYQMGVYSGCKWFADDKDGTDFIRYRVKEGDLPPGLIMNELGLISGAPTTLGSFTFTITAWHLTRDYSADKEFTIIVTDRLDSPQLSK